jgi:hypothetical protein
MSSSWFVELSLLAIQALVGGVEGAVCCPNAPIAIKTNPANTASFCMHRPPEPLTS